MNARNRLTATMLVLVAACAIIALAAIAVLYRTALNEERELLVETARSNARLIEVMGRLNSRYYDRTPPDITTALNPYELTISQIRAAHTGHASHGKSGAIVLGKREGDSLLFILDEDRLSLTHPVRVPFSSRIGEPMRRALSGKSGTIIGRDYRGVTVMAAYEPLHWMGLGLVAKVDLARVQAPFIRAGLIVCVIAVFVVLSGALLISRINNPIIKRLKTQTGDLQLQIEEHKRSEKTIRERDATIKALFDASDYSILMIDPAGVVIAANRRICDILGKQEAELIGTTIFDYIDPDLAESRRARVDEVVRTGKPIRFEDQFNGEERANTLFPIFDEYGNVTRVAIYTRDITAQKRAEEALRKSEERFRKIFSDSAVGMDISALDGSFLEVNRRFCEITGYSEKELLSMGFEDVTYPEDAETQREFIKTLLSGDIHSFNMEKRYIHKSGRVIWVDLTVSLLLNKYGSPGYFVGQVVDIGERKNMSIEMEKMLKEIVFRNRELKTFAYAISHDLKTPLVTIEGFTGVLKSEYEQQLGSEGVRYLDRIDAAAQSMNEKIDLLIEYSRAGRETREPSSVPANRVIFNAVESHREAIDKRGIDLAVQDIPWSLRGDELQFQQVFENLISNAVKYMRPDADNPRVEIGAERRDGETIFHVKDNGVGISPGYKDKIFEIFQRLPSSLKIEGRGVGLAIVKRIVEAGNGRIWVESTPGEGSVFYFTLPTV